MCFKYLLYFFILSFFISCGVIFGKQDSKQLETSLKNDTEITFELAQSGDKEARYRVGRALCCGVGLEYNNKRGYEYICNSAKNNFPDSQYYLAQLFETGIPKNPQSRENQDFFLDKNIIISYMWYKMAANNGVIKAKSDLARLAKTVSSSDINTSEELITVVDKFTCAIPYSK